MDDCDYDRVSQYKWSALVSGKYVYGMTGYGANRKLLHRFILDAPKGTLVDHRNHDTLDNTRANLRLASRSQNNANARLRKDNPSGIKGVKFLGSGKRSPWMATVAGRYVGVYATKEEAGAAYLRAAQERYGDYAYYESR